MKIFYFNSETIQSDTVTVVDTYHYIHVRLLRLYNIKCECYMNLGDCDVSM